MIAREAADLLPTVRVGKMKWLACCPVHDDCEFQLTITHVPDCGARVECSQHCSIDEIANAMGSSRADLESHPAPEPDMDDLDDAAACRFYAAKIKRQDQHQIVGGKIQRQLRQVDLQRRQSENARKAGGDHDASLLTDALDELRQLRLLEKKWRA